MAAIERLRSNGQIENLRGQKTILKGQTGPFTNFRQALVFREWIKAYHHKKLSPRAVMV